MSSILVIDHNRASLAVARALHGLGYRVIAGVDGYCDYANLSRFVAETIAISDSAVDPDGLIADLHRLKRQRPDLTGVFSVDEGATRLLAERRADLPVGLICYASDPDNILSSFNKSDSAALAESLGIPVAPRCVVDTLEDLHAAARDIGAPFVVRAVESNHDLYGVKVLVCHSMEQFQRIATHWPREGHQQLMVQRYNAGHRHNICWTSISGHIHSAIEMRVLLSTTGTQSGYGTLVETVEPHPALKYYASQLAEALNYHGAGSPQFLVDEKTGEITFLEINPRLDANIKLAQSVMTYIEDFVGIIDGRITDLQLDPWAYQRGRRLFWMKGENQTLRTLKAEGRYGQMAARAAMMLPNSIGNVHGLFSWDDPAPALASHLNPLLQRLPLPLLPDAMRWAREPQASTQA